MRVQRKRRKIPNHILRTFLMPVRLAHAHYSGGIVPLKQHPLFRLYKLPVGRPLASKMIGHSCKPIRTRPPAGRQVFVNTYCVYFTSHAWGFVYTTLVIRSCEILP